MKLHKSVVCNACVFKQDEICQAGYISAPATRDECWQFRNKRDRLNLSTRSGESSGDRLSGVWQN